MKVIFYKKISCMIFFFLLLITNCSYFSNRTAVSTDIINIDYSMPLEVAHWLKLLNLDNNYLDVKEYFLSEIASTSGCKVMLQYINTFKECEKKDLYKIIIEALYASKEKEIYKTNGYYTSYGRLKNIWLNVLSQPDDILDKVNKLKSYHLNEQVLSLIKKRLPDDKKINATFNFYTFGDIESPLMGIENGIDILNLPLDENGKIDKEKIINKISHYVYGNVIDQFAEDINTKIKNDDKIYLLQILVKNGMSAFFFNNYSECFLNNRNYYLHDFPDIWESGLNRIPELYFLAEHDLQKAFQGKIQKEDISDFWLSGKINSATFLGYGIISLINKYFGTDELLKAVSDYRKLILLYDKASNLAYINGENVFRFNKKFVYRLAYFTN